MNLKAAPHILASADQSPNQTAEGKRKAASGPALTVR